MRALVRPPVRAWLPALLAAPASLAIALGLYARALHAPFVFDDVVFADSPVVHVTSWAGVWALVAAQSIPRKLTMVSFALNFWLDGLRPVGYHVVNVVLHGLAGWCLFLLGRVLLARTSDPWWRAHATQVAALGALLWLVHPVHTQAVIYTWQRSTVLCTGLYLAALLAYAHGRVHPPGWRRAAWWVAGIVAGAGALATKEIAATLPAAVWLVERRFFAEDRRVPVWMMAAVVGLLGLIAWDYLGPRFVPMMTADFARRGFTPAERLLTESRVVLHYAGLLAVPHPSRLMVDYDVTLSRSLVSPWYTALAVGAVAGLVVAAVAGWRRAPLLSFAVLWYFGHLVIESTVVPLDLAYEHRLYLPSTLPLVLGAGAVWRALGATRAGQAALILVLAMLMAWTAVRVEVWRDPVRLWQDNASKTPDKARVFGQLGKACLEVRDRPCAWRAFTRAVALDPTLAAAENGLASVLIDLDGDLSGAEALLRGLLAREPTFVPALVNLGVLQLRRREPGAAFETLARAVRLEPNHRLVLFNLGSAALALGRLDDAAAVTTRGVRVWPRDAALRALRGLVAHAGGDAAAARRDADAADALDPNDAVVRQLRARLVSLPR